MGIFKAEIIEGKYEKKLYRCPFCGHVFTKAKQYTKHLWKSHILKGFKTKRLQKKLIKYIEIIKQKLEKKEELTPFERRVYLLAKTRGLIK